MEPVTLNISGPSDLPAGPQVTLALLRAAINTDLAQIVSDIATVQADVRLLRALGAKLDGLTDDLAAFQSVIAQARATTPAVSGTPTVVFDIGGCAVLLSGPVQTGTCHVVFRGSAPNVGGLYMVSGGSGIIQHGTASNPAVGYLHIENLLLKDLNINGSGAAAVSAVFATSAADSCLTLQGLEIQKFSQAFSLTDTPRGLHAQNVTIFGPDNAIQNAPAIGMVSTAGFTAGDFSSTWINVLTANYRNGWEYNIASALEGQVFYSCRSYNGWGLIQVRNTAPNGYKSLLWSFTDCDWQGLGFALDMQGCRNVSVRGGYWIANVNTSGLLPPSSAPRRRYFSFEGCTDVRLDQLEIDVLPGQDQQLSLVYCDAACQRVRITRNVFISYSTVYAAIELDANPNSNVICEVDTDWALWIGGPRILDAGNNQIMQSLARGENTPGDGRGYYGDVTTQGRWIIGAVTAPLTADSNGNVSVVFPTRPGGSPFFIGGAPRLLVSTMNTNSFIASASILTISHSGFTATLGPSGAGIQFAISYEALGV